MSDKSSGMIAAMKHPLYIAHLCIGDQHTAVFAVWWQANRPGVPLPDGRNEAIKEWKNEKAVKSN